MGSWIGMGILKYRPDRLLSISLGGWDPAPNKLLSASSRMTIDDVIEMVPDDSAELVSWVTPDIKPGLAACLAALGNTDVQGDLLIDAGIPIHLWVGDEDPYLEGVKEIHSKITDSVLDILDSNHILAFRHEFSPYNVRRFVNNLRL